MHRARLLAISIESDNGYYVNLRLSLALRVAAAYASGSDTQAECRCDVHSQAIR